MDELAAAAGADPLAFRLAHLKNAAFAGRAGKGRQGVRLGRRSRSRRRRTSAWGWPAAPRRAPTWPPAPRWRSTAATARSASAAYARHSSAARSSIRPICICAESRAASSWGWAPALLRGDAVPRRQDPQLRVSTSTACRGSRTCPQMDVHLLESPGPASAGAGETPIIAIAPAVANAVFHATGKRSTPCPSASNGSEAA